MSKRIIRVLHIEDDHFQRRVLTHLLKEIDEFEFEIACAESERGGLDLFDIQGADLVILDYRLTEGDGLHCLKELRCRDPNVPIIAVSGEASPSIARELVECGADDYLDKKELAGHVLARSVRDVLSRWDAWQRTTTRIAKCGSTGPTSPATPIQTQRRCGT
jgi:DNA-binding NarL/FixJ family response regulator